MKGTADLLNLIEPRLPDLVSKPDEYQRQFAAAGLARCAALLKGIVALMEADLEEDAGVLLRSLTEVWAVSLYVMLGPPGAVQDLAFDAKEELRKLKEDYKALKPLSTGLLASFQAMIGNLDGAAQFASKKSKAGLPRSLSTAQIMKDELPKLLSSVSLGTIVYTHIFRVESMLSTHAGLLSIEPYLDSSKEPWSVRRTPKRPFLEGNAEAAGAQLTVMLAACVFEGFGYDPSPFKAVEAAVIKERKEAVPT